MWSPASGAWVIDEHGVYSTLVFYFTAQAMAIAQRTNR
jgi:hypothetical protein